MRVLTATDLSQHLTLEEMTRSAKAHQLGIRNVPDPTQHERLRQWAGAIFQPLRDHFGVPLYVSSGLRVPALNTAIAGRPTDSQHQRGEAGDLDQDGSPHGVTNRDVFYFTLRRLPFDQLIWEFGDDQQPDWVHVSYACGRAGRHEVRRAVRSASGTVSYPLFPVR